MTINSISSDGSQPPLPHKVGLRARIKSLAELAYNSEPVQRVIEARVEREERFTEQERCKALDLEASANLKNARAKRELAMAEREFARAEIDRQRARLLELEIRQGWQRMMCEQKSQPMLNSSTGTSASDRKLLPSVGNDQEGLPQSQDSSDSGS